MLPNLEGKLPDLEGKLPNLGGKLTYLGRNMSNLRRNAVIKRYRKLTAYDLRDKRNPRPEPKKLGRIRQRPEYGLSDTESAVLYVLAFRRK